MRSVLKVVSVRVLVAFALTSGVASAIDAQAASPQSVTETKSNAATVSPWPLLRGQARVLDGDTIDVAISTGTVRVRLEGIDAPEGGQRCNLKWLGTWDCGKAATLALTSLIREREVVCEDRGLDKYSRTLGICFVQGRDINAEMVRAGLAWAFVRYSTVYVAQENEARAAKAGVWQAPTQAPWDWRAQQKLAKPAEPQTLTAPMQRAESSSQHAPPGCDIKGAITKNGRIYHTTASPWYERVQMNLGFGRRWFCSEAEAREAGWRPALAEKSESDPRQ